MREVGSRTTRGAGCGGERAAAARRAVGKGVVVVSHLTASMTVVHGGDAIMFDRPAPCGATMTLACAKSPIMCAWLVPVADI